MTDRELLQQSLAMLEDINQCSLPPTGIPLPAEIDHVMEALRARLAQPEPESFEYWNAVEGWVTIEEVRQHFDTAGCGTIYKTAGEDRVPLYAAPPKKEWVGLTDQEYEAMAEQYVTNCYFDTLKYAKAIEAKLRDKNS
jgi:hypothetical protein